MLILPDKGILDFEYVETKQPQAEYKKTEDHEVNQLCEMMLGLQKEQRIRVLSRIAAEYQFSTSYLETHLIKLFKEREEMILCLSLVLPYLLDPWNFHPFAERNFPLACHPNSNSSRVNGGRSVWMPACSSRSTSAPCGPSTRPIPMATTCSTWRSIATNSSCFD